MTRRERIAAAPACPACGHRIVVEAGRFVGHYPEPGHVADDAQPCAGSGAEAT